MFIVREVFFSSLIYGDKLVSVIRLLSILTAVFVVSFGFGVGFQRFGVVGLEFTRISHGAKEFYIFGL